jgi:hypothetical protein
LVEVLRALADIGVDLGHGLRAEQAVGAALGGDGIAELPSDFAVSGGAEAGTAGGPEQRCLGLQQLDVSGRHQRSEALDGRLF